jgi:hypothetical protein
VSAQVRRHLRTVSLLSVRMAARMPERADIYRTESVSQTAQLVVYAVQRPERAQSGAYCKTVGSAYVGSNPTPATTCGNGPRPAIMAGRGPFSSCPGVCFILYRRRARCKGSYGRIADGTGPEPTVRVTARHPASGIRHRIVTLT